MKILVTLSALAAVAALGAGDATAQGPDIERAQAAFADDVHADAGLTCTACHAGQATPMSPPRTDIARSCATCHSNAAYMRNFAPQIRVDQLAQYMTSVHGRRMAEGEDRVATCSDCHGAHGIRRVADSRSPVAPLNQAATCAVCHADAEHMAPFGVPPTPVADWMASVHAAALLKRGDTSAPTCSTCHGSHGAAPPGVESVVNVCGQCHVREAELFRASPKNDIFAVMGQPECLVCHENHRIESPGDDWIGVTGDAVCALCHDDGMNGIVTIDAVRGHLDTLSTAISAADDTLMGAERAGMLVDEGRAALREARESRINARVLVHAFAEPPVAAVTGPGIDAAMRAETTGRQALQELQYRRRGLGIATVLLVGFLVTLWLKIRSLPDHD